MEKINKIVVAIVVFFLLSSMLTIQMKVEAQNPSDITPGYWETSEYLIGNVSVAIILPESNGTIDPNTENWTDAEIAKVLSEINISLTWLASQNPNASVSFVTEVHFKVPTSYEPISRPESEAYVWMSQVISYLGYSLSGHWTYQMRDFASALREKFKSNWAFIIFVVDSSNDSDGMFKGGGCAAASVGGTSLHMTYTNGNEGIENMDRVCAHEIGHIFWASGETTETIKYSGYLNISNVPRSGCLMDNLAWKLSGATHGNNGTWGQVGWRDSDNDGIQDIVDTNQNVYINPPVTIGNRLNLTGVAAVTPYTNNNPSTRNPQGRRNVTVSAIKTVQVRIDSGTWQNATIIPTITKKMIKYPNTYVDKQTYSVVNFTFLKKGISAGNHTIQVRVYDNWNNTGYANQTVTITPSFPTDLYVDGRVDIVDLCIVAWSYLTHDANYDQNGNPKPGEPASQWWNPYCDFDKNHLVNLDDVIMVAKDFGRTT